MKKRSFEKYRFVRTLLCLLFPFIFVLPGRSFAQSSALKLVFIRHAERPDNGENLNCAGFNRSVLLPAVLYRKFGLADDIFIPSLKLGSVTKRSRMLETILPYTIKYNLSINSKYDEDDSKGLSAALLKQTGTVIIVWDHTKIPDIVRALGITRDLKWERDDFDSILIITFPKGKPVLKIDREGLNPPQGCPF
jgi:hypothetical protein